MRGGQVIEGVRVCISGRVGQRFGGGESVRIYTGAGLLTFTVYRMWVGQKSFL